MFKIGKDQEPIEDLGDKIVIDEERNVSLKLIRGPGRAIEWGKGDTYRLVWGDRTIAFVASREEMKDPTTGQVYYLAKFQSFGGRGVGPLKYRIESIQFQNEEERQQAKMLAVEAMLMISSNYNGDTRPEGYDRVEFEGHIYTKRDFGMA